MPSKYKHSIQFKTARLRYEVAAKVGNSNRMNREMEKIIEYLRGNQDWVDKNELQVRQWSDDNRLRYEHKANLAAMLPPVAQAAPIRQQQESNTASVNTVVANEKEALLWAEIQTADSVMALTKIIKKNAHQIPSLAKQQPSTVNLLCEQMIADIDNPARVYDSQKMAEEDLIPKDFGIRSRYVALVKQEHLMNARELQVDIAHALRYARDSLESFYLADRNKRHIKNPFVRRQKIKNIENELGGYLQPFDKSKDLAPTSQSEYMDLKGLHISLDLIYARIMQLAQDHENRTKAGRSSTAAALYQAVKMLDDVYEKHQLKRPETTLRNKLT